jgi:DNA-binding IclR family transcriptional regulator
MRIELAQERRIVAKLVIDTLRAFARHYSPSASLARSIEVQALILPIFVAHIEGRVLTASQIARIAGSPRATVVRKLQWLTDNGFLVKKGHGYCMTLEKGNHPNTVALARANIRRVKAAAKRLSKLDR